MGTQNTGKRLFAVIGDPCELAAVVVEETWGEAYASSGGNICKGRVVIRTIEIPNLSSVYQSAVDSLQRRRRTAAYHQGTSIEILFPDDVLPGKRIAPVRNQIDAAFKQLMDGNAGDLFCLLSQREQDIDLVPQKRLDSAFVVSAKSRMASGRKYTACRTMRPMEMLSR